MARGSPPLSEALGLVSHRALPAPLRLEPSDRFFSANATASDAVMSPKIGDGPCSRKRPCFFQLRGEIGALNIPHRFPLFQAGSNLYGLPLERELSRSAFRARNRWTLVFLVNLRYLDSLLLFQFSSSGNEG